MTNPATPGNPPVPPSMPPSAPPPGGGIPKWLIIVIVAFIVVSVGCCGGVYTCMHFLHKAAQSGASAFEQAAKEMQAEAQRQAAEARQRAAAQGGAAADGAGDAAPEQPATPPARTDAAAGNAPTAGAPADAGAAKSSIADAWGSGKLPSNFPTDVTLPKGLNPTGLSTADKVKGSGMATFSSTTSHADIVSSFETDMPKQAWTMTTNQDFGGQTVMAFTKEKRKATVQIMPDSNPKNSIIIITYENQP